MIHTGNDTSTNLIEDTTPNPRLSNQIIISNSLIVIGYSISYSCWRLL